MIRALARMARDEDTLARLLHLPGRDRAPAVAVLLWCGDQVAVTADGRVPMAAVAPLLEVPEITAARVCREVLGVAGVGMRWLDRTDLEACAVDVYGFAGTPATVLGPGAVWTTRAELAARRPYAGAWLARLSAATVVG